MERRTQLILKAAQSLGIATEQLHFDGNVYRLSYGDIQTIIANGRGDWLGQAQGIICQDKGFQYELLQNTQLFPITKTYCDPELESQYQSYIRHPKISDIIQDIEEHFVYPVVIKPNRGSQGRGVNICKNADEVTVALQNIFNKDSSEYDYVAVVQEYIAIHKEYRVICIQGNVHTVIYKDITQATFTGNLSPLHWDGAVPRIVNNSDFHNQIQEVITPLFQEFPLFFVGIDLGLDQQGNWSVIELNSHPGFAYFLQFESESYVIDIYRELLRQFFHIPYKMKTDQQI